MNTLENEFFEEYKRLDHLCRDLLKTDNGVTEYITQMETVPVTARYRILSWDSDYKALKHARWIRNNIAHGDGTSECSKQDINFVRNFYERILDRDDPFAQLQMKNGNRHTPSQPDNRSSQRQAYEPEQSNHNRLIVVAAISLIILIAAVLIFISNGQT